MGKYYAKLLLGNESEKYYGLATLFEIDDPTNDPVAAIQKQSDIQLGSHIDAVHIYEASGMGEYGQLIDARRITTMWLGKPVSIADAIEKSIQAYQAAPKQSKDIMAGILQNWVKSYDSGQRVAIQFWQGGFSRMDSGDMIINAQKQQLWPKRSVLGRQAPRCNGLTL